jgi:hypothetical protein
MLAVAEIISKPQFQRYLKNFVTPLLGSEPFQWTKCTPPWRLPTLIRWRLVEESWRRPESKGIFILPHEMLEETWNIYINMPEFRRSAGKTIVNNKSIRCYKPNGWLNDELVNSYIALLRDDKSSIKVTESYVFQKIQNPLQYNKDFFKRIVRLVFSTTPFFVDQFAAWWEKPKQRVNHRKTSGPIFEDIDSAKLERFSLAFSCSEH